MARTVSTCLNTIDQIRWDMLWTTIIRRHPSPIYEQCVGGQRQEVQAVEGCVGRVRAGLHQAEQQGQLQGVVAARGNHVAAERVGQQPGEPPGRAGGGGPQHGPEVLADLVRVCGGGG